MRRLEILVAATFVAILLSLGGCSDGGAAARAQAQRAHDEVQSALLRLREDLARNRVRNAALLRSYADLLAEAKPDLKQITDVFRLEATSDGRLYQGLRKRLQENRAALPPPDAPAKAS